MSGKTEEVSYLWIFILMCVSVSMCSPEHGAVVKDESCSEVIQNSKGDL